MLVAMNEPLEKVTVFIVNSHSRGVLLFQHPNAGIQFPAGTVEPGETAIAAALREAAEETGLQSKFLTNACALHVDQKNISPFCANLGTVHGLHRPEPSAASWVTFPHGRKMEVVREDGDWVQVRYSEGNKLPNPEFNIVEITVWVRRAQITQTERRTFVSVNYEGEMDETWNRAADNHIFKLFWSDVNSLPDIVPPQDKWVAILRNADPASQF